MSGTSADGIDVALVRIRGGLSFSKRQPRPSGGSYAIKLLGHAAFPYARDVRNAVLSAMNATSASVADLSRLNVELIGCHGQTIYHQGDGRPFLGQKIATTWQTGEGSVLVARTGVPVVSDFRPADMAVGGKGAPLVPFFDYVFYRDASIGRIVQNIGGISNLTAIPAAASLNQVRAFDTGPGNM